MRARSAWSASSYSSTKVDIADPELLDLVVSEVTDALDLQGFRGSPVVLGSALRALRDPAADGACIGALLDAMQTHSPTPYETSMRLS